LFYGDPVFRSANCYHIFNWHGRILRSKQPTRWLQNRWADDWAAMLRPQPGAMPRRRSPANATPAGLSSTMMLIL
jgi:hypothetical protein